MRENLTMLTDFYELTMMQGFLKSGNQDTVIFDLFYRTNPSDGAYAICAGLAQAIEYVNNLTFTEEDIEYLRSLQCFDEEFLAWLLGFKFTGDIYAIPEGSVVFPMEPLVKVIAPVMEAQLVETALLNIINHQSLIATKASRVCYAAKGRPVMEFGLRRAQGPDAGIYGARAAVIGGCQATSNVLAAKNFELPVFGTHAHSWIMSFEDELTAFRTYAEFYPKNCTLLVDTYDVLRSGIPNAIKVFDEKKREGKLPQTFGVRIDSGDLAYLSKQARKMLDAAGYPEALICASSDLDEHLITSLLSQGADIDVWGVGTNLITSSDCPAFGGVYKLAAMKKGEVFLPKIKRSENQWKITNPGNKKIYRIYDKKTHKIKADLIALEEETLDPSEPLLLFDPVNTWKKTRLPADSYEFRELLVPVFQNGRCVYETPSTKEIQENCRRELETLWEENRRLVNPQEVYVDLSDALYQMKKTLLDSFFGC